MKIKHPKTNRHTPRPADSGHLYLVYKDRYQGLIRKRKRIGLHPDRTIKKLILHPDKVDINRRCLAWPYCDVEVEDNNYNVACYAHWYLLPRCIRSAVQAVLRRFPKRSKTRQAIMKKVKDRLQLAGKRGEVVRSHLSDYTVVEERRGQL